MRFHVCLRGVDLDSLVSEATDATATPVYEGEVRVVRLPVTDAGWLSKHAINGT